MTPEAFDHKYPFLSLYDQLARRRGELAAWQYLGSRRGLFQPDTLTIEPVTLPEAWRRLRLEIQA